MKFIKKSTGNACFRFFYAYNLLSDGRKSRGDLKFCPEFYTPSDDIIKNRDSRKVFKDSKNTIFSFSEIFPSLFI